MDIVSVSRKDVDLFILQEKRDEISIQILFEINAIIIFYFLLRFLIDRIDF